VTNTAGNKLSAKITLTVTPAAPFFALNPTNQTGPIGTNMLLASEARGTGPIVYQWYFNGTNALANATNASLTLSNLQPATAGNYSVVATNPLGSATSDVAQISLEIGPTSPTITAQPDDQTTTVCSPAAFSVSASGLALSYQWWFNTTNALAGETGSTLTIAAPRPALAGDYQVVVSNPGGSVTSEVATLTVVLGDQDADGMPDAWELAHGFNPCSAADRDLDADGDGQSNWEEAVSGTDPHSASSVLKVTLVNGGSGGARIQFTAMPNIGYSILYRASLSEGQWLKLEDVTPQASTHPVDVLDPNARSAGGRFYRVVTPMQSP
jgi:hypothetical protein